MNFFCCLVQQAQALKFLQSDYVNWADTMLVISTSGLMRRVKHVAVNSMVLSVVLVASVMMKSIAKVNSTRPGIPFTALFMHSPLR